MKRRLTLSFVLLSGLLWTPPASAAKFIKGPYLQGVTTDGITVMWETDEASPARVEYGRDGQWLGRAEVTEPKVIQEVRIEGLTAETSYQYRAVAGDATAGPFTFRTAVKPESPFRYVVYGDNRNNPTIHRGIVQAIAKRKPAFLINTGDLVSNGDDYSQWGPMFFEPLADLISSVPYYPVPGNHEGRGKLYTGFFSLPAPEYYYTFHYGNTKFVAIDSSLRQANYLASGSEQNRWIVKQLESDGAAWTIVVFHHPPYSSHPDRGSSVSHVALLCPLLEKGKVDLVFNGHNHNYERIYPMKDRKRDDEAGVPYIITGGGGAPLYPVQSDWFTVTAESVNHYCVLDVQGVELTLVAYTTDGRVLDRFMLCKDPSHLTKLADQARSEKDAARREAVERLSYFFSPRMPGILSDFAGDGDVAVRRAVAGGLGRLAMAAGRETALKLVGDADAEVRRGAALAIARTSGPDELEDIKKLLGDTDVVVRRNASWFFIHHSSPQLVELISLALHDADPEVRRRAIRGVRDVHDTSVVPILTAGAADADGLVARTAILAAVADKRVDALGDGIAKAVENKDAGVRLAALKALAASAGRRKAVPVFIRALNDPDAKVQGQAAGALEGLSGKRYGYDQKKWEKWWSEQPK